MMDTIEARSDPSSPIDSTYDGFISYSHAADDLLAPRLQSGLQKFAKPWWKRRALRIFRDESSLSANPHLWSSITAALDESAWFVPLLSPEAAGSPWVNQEIEYWLEHKDPDRIIPVVTDGEFGWSETDIDQESTAAPPALYGAFADEPRWVDLRFAHTEEQLDLNNPEFSAAVADIASAIRGVPKDELASEEVRQHRRTVRTAWGAGIALLALTLLAGGAALYANGQRTEADQQRSAAEASAEAEAAAAAEAESQRAEAEAQTVIAEEQANLARSRELAASAVGVADRDPELSLLLTLAAFDATPQDASFPEGTIALREALARQNLIARFPVGTGITDVAISADGSKLVALSSSDRSITMFDTASQKPIWDYVDTETVDTYWQIYLSPDESYLAAVVWNERIAGDFTDIGVADGEQDSLPARLVLLSADDGSVLRTITFEDCAYPRVVGPAFSPDGRYLQIHTGEPCDAGDLTAEFAALYDTETWEEATRFHRDAFDTSVVFSEDMSTIAVRGDAAPTELLTWPDLELLHEFKPSHTAAISPDGSTLALAAAVGIREGSDRDFRPHLYDASTGELVDVLSGAQDLHSDAGLSFSSDGTQLYLATRGADIVWDVESGEVLHALHSGATHGLSATADGSSLATAGQAGEVLLWNLAPTEEARPIELSTGFPVWINPNQIIDGEPTALTMFSIADDGTEEGWLQRALVVIDPETGDVINELGVRDVTRTADGRFVVLPEAVTPQTGSIVGPLAIWDPQTGSLEMLGDCVVDGADLTGFDPATCPDGSPIYGDYLTTSQDGSTIAAGSYRSIFDPSGPIEFLDSGSYQVIRNIETDELLDQWQTLTPGWMIAVGEDLVARVIDPTTGELLATPGQGEYFKFASQLSADGTSIFLASETTPGLVWTFDTSTWEGEAWTAHDEGVRGFALSPDGSMLATTGEDDFVKIWSLPDRKLLDKIPADFPSDAMWIDDNTMGIALADGARWAVVTLDVQELLRQARTAVTRTFTDEECTLYSIDPCPTLDQIKGA
jgi:WD40 repeat protein